MIDDVKKLVIKKLNYPENWNDYYDSEDKEIHMHYSTNCKRGAGPFNGCTDQTCNCEDGSIEMWVPKSIFKVARLCQPMKANFTYKETKIIRRLIKEYKEYNNEMEMKKFLNHWRKKDK